MKKIVFDSSAFLNRFYFDDLNYVYTTNSVISEILNNNQKSIFENLIYNAKIKVQDPKKDTINIIKKKCSKQLSFTDIEVLALAYELNAELHTDDFMMRKTARDFKIEIKSIAYDIKSDNNFLDKVYNKIKPTKEELLAINKLSKNIISKLNKEAKKMKLPIKKIILAGSSARGTFLHNKKDLDIFCLYDLKVSIEDVKKYNETLLRKAYPKVNFVEEYGEHPYLKAIIENHAIDFVPGFYIKNIKDKKSSVDRTPLHLKFLNKHQNEDSKKQIILLKQFLKNNLLYGADQKNNGFSGYLTELFILKFKTFENVLKNMSNLNENKYLTILKNNKKKKFDDYLVFLDPTDKNRNVASAVSKKNWLIFEKLAKEYLIKPSQKYFFSDIYENNLKNIFCFKLNINGKTFDSNWGIIKSITKKISNDLNTKHYKIENYSGIYFNNKGYIILETNFKDIINGPFIKDTKNSKAFKRKHKNTFEKNNKLYSEFKFNKTQFIKEVKKSIKSLTNMNSEKVNFNTINFDREELKRMKKDFLKV